MELLAPYKCPGEKVSIGRNEDGGYVIMKPVNPFTWCYSYGISDDISFEKDLFEKYGTMSLLFDHTIESIDGPFTLYKEGVSHEKTDSCDTIENHIKRFGETRDMILKMDVETCEWNVLRYINPETLKKFSQIVIELHFYGPDVHMDALRNLTKEFKVIHLHGNPYIENRYLDVTEMFPRVLEVTLLRNDLFFQVDMDGMYPDPRVDTRLNIEKPLTWWKLL
jgi:hypothetical protein